MLPVGIGLRDPRSQKRDLGHPSISPFDIAEGTSFVISPVLGPESVVDEMGGYVALGGVDVFRDVAGETADDG